MNKFLNDWGLILFVWLSLLILKLTGQSHIHPVWLIIPPLSLLFIGFMRILGSIYAILGFAGITIITVAFFVLRIAMRSFIL